MAKDAQESACCSRPQRCGVRGRIIGPPNRSRDSPAHQPRSQRPMPEEAETRSSRSGDPPAVDSRGSNYGNPVWVNCRDPAVVRGGQLHPSKATNPPARSIVSSVPIADVPRTSPTGAVEPSQSPSLGDGLRPIPDVSLRRAQIETFAEKSKKPYSEG
jgi:hypothetical protein